MSWPFDPAASGDTSPPNVSEMELRMRRPPWENTPGGPVASWPFSLKLSVRTLLDCRLPMCLAWGESQIQFFNDAYLPSLGNKQDTALGQDARVTWADIWPVMAERWGRAWRGES